MNNEPFFPELVAVLRSRRTRANYAALAADDVAADEGCIGRIRQVLQGPADCILVGSSNSGKTISASILGLRLVNEGWHCFYEEARNLTDISGAAHEVMAFERGARSALFVIDDCHVNQVKVEDLVSRLPANRQKSSLLLVTRSLGGKESLLQGLHEDGQSAMPSPRGVRPEIVRKHVERLRQRTEYSEAAYLPKGDEEFESQSNQLLARLPLRNLRVLDHYLQAWDPRRELLSSVQESLVLERLLADAKPRLDSPVAKSGLLPLYALAQFEVRVHSIYIGSSTAEELHDIGLISCDPAGSFCQLQDPSAAVWYLKAAEQAHLLSIDDIASSLQEYVRHHVLEYGARAPNPHELLKAVSDSDKGLGTLLSTDTRFMSNVSRLVTSGLLYDGLPVLLDGICRLRQADKFDSVLALLDDAALEQIAQKDVSTLASYLTSFAAGGLPGRRASARLLAKEQADAACLGQRLSTALAANEYSVGELAWLLCLLNNLRTYDIATLIGGLDLAELSNRFPETRLTSYMALVREVKRARVGMGAVNQLMPDLGSLIPRVKTGTLRHTREVMDAQLMHDRKALWQQLYPQDIQDISSRSTLNQCNNLLEDAAKSANPESWEFGRKIAATLLSVDLGPLMLAAGFKDVGMLVKLVLDLDTGLAEPLLDQLLRVGLDRLMEAEKDSSEVIGHLSHILRHFGAVPRVQTQLLANLMELDLESHVLDAKPNGLRWFVYSALWASEAEARNWCLSIPPEIWRAKLLESTPEEAFYLLLNLYQAAETLACKLGQTIDLTEKIGASAEGFGLLSMCGVNQTPSRAVVQSAAITALGNDQAVDPGCHPIRFALILKALCNPSMSNLALKLQERLDFTQLEHLFEAADVPEHTRRLLLVIVTEFVSVYQ